MYTYNLLTYTHPCTHTYNDNNIDDNNNNAVIIIMIMIIMLIIIMTSTVKLTIPTMIMQTNNKNVKQAKVCKKKTLPVV